MFFSSNAFDAVGQCHSLQPATPEIWKNSNHELSTCAATSAGGRECRMDLRRGNTGSITGGSEERPPLQIDGNGTTPVGNRGARQHVYRGRGIDQGGGFQYKSGSVLNLLTSTY
jgi:hypothetical protein